MPYHGALCLKPATKTSVKAVNLAREGYAAESPVLSVPTAPAKNMSTASARSIPPSVSTFRSRSLKFRSKASRLHPELTESKEALADHGTAWFKFQGNESFFSEGQFALFGRSEPRSFSCLNFAPLR